MCTLEFFKNKKKLYKSVIKFLQFEPKKHNYFLLDKTLLFSKFLKKFLDFQNSKPKQKTLADFKISFFHFFRMPNHNFFFLGSNYSNHFNIFTLPVCPIKYHRMSLRAPKILSLKVITRLFITKNRVFKITKILKCNYIVS